MNARENLMEKGNFSQRSKNWLSSERDEFRFTVSYMGQLDRDFFRFFFKFISVYNKNSIFTSHKELTKLYFLDFFRYPSFSRFLVIWRQSSLISHKALSHAFTSDQNTICAWLKNSEKKFSNLKVNTLARIFSL